MDDKTKPAVELDETALEQAAGGITDGTSNTIMVGETQKSGGSGIADGTSNTILVGETVRPVNKFPHLTLQGG